MSEHLSVHRDEFISQWKTIYVKLNELMEKTKEIENHLNHELILFQTAESQVSTVDFYNPGDECETPPRKRMKKTEK